MQSFAKNAAILARRLVRNVFRFGLPFARVEHTTGGGASAMRNLKVVRHKAEVKSRLKDEVKNERLGFLFFSREPSSFPKNTRIVAGTEDAAMMVDFRLCW